MNPAWIDFLVCFFFGVFGVHRFRLGQVGWGLLYLITFGFGGVMWLIDCLRFFIVAASGKRIIHIYGLVHFVTVPAVYSVEVPLRPRQVVPTEVVGAANFVLSAGERLIYSGPASFVSVASVGGRPAPNAEGKLYPGTLAVTSKRIIFTGAQGTLDRPFSDLTSMTELPDGAALQFSNRIYPFQTSDAAAISRAIAEAVNSPSPSRA